MRKSSFPLVSRWPVALGRMSTPRVTIVEVHFCSTMDDLQAMDTDMDTHNMGGARNAQEKRPPEDANRRHLQEVHKNYRVIEGSRQNYHNESESILRRQEALLQTLTNDNRILQERVDSYMIPDVTAEASRMQAEADKFTVLLEQESRNLETKENALRNSLSQWRSAKRDMGGIFAAREKHRLAVIRGAVTENRLHKTLLKTNAVENKNKAMKRLVAEINTEREFYDRIKQNVEHELHNLEKGTVERINETKYLYLQRNDFEERITDVHEIATDMAAYNIWRETEGWAIMDPEPLAKVINPAEHFTGAKGPAPNECSAKERSWIELKALGLIQDIFDVDECIHVVDCIRRAQAHNNALFELVTQYIKQMTDEDERLLASAVNFDVQEISKTGMINRRLDMENTLEKILDLLKELDMPEDELMPIIRKMRNHLCTAFKEAGCNVEDDEIDYGEDSSPTVRYKSGKSEPLDVAIVEFFVSVEYFVEQLSGFKH